MHCMLRKAKVIRAAVLLSVIVALVSPAAFAARDRAGRTEGTIGASRVLATVWKKGGSFRKVTHVSMQGDVLFVAGKPRGLTAYRASDGTRLWQHIGRMPVEFPPTVWNEKVYLVEGGQLVTLEADNGAELSRDGSRVGFVTSVYPGERCWMVGSTDDYVVGMIPEKRVKMWRANVGGNILGSVWDRRDLGYFTTDRGELYCVSISAWSDIDIKVTVKGEVMSEANVGLARAFQEYTHSIWKHRFKRAVGRYPVLGGGLLYVGSADYYLYGLHPKQGKVDRKFCLEAPVMGKPVVTRRRVYVSTTDGILYACDLKEDQVVWKLPGVHEVLTTTEDHVIYLRRGRSVNVVGVADHATGEIISEVRAARHKFFVAPPMGGIFYAVTRTGDVMAVGDRGALAAMKAEKGKSTAGE